MIWVSETTVKDVALTVPNMTAVAPVKLLPVMVTVVPPAATPDVGEIEKWLRMRVLSEHKARRLRDVLLELYPLPLSKVPVTDPDASAEDDIGLR